MEYTLNLKSKEDYRIIKKILKAFDGASIKPMRVHKTSLEKSLEEAQRGEVVGPFYSVNELMSDLLS